MKRALLFALFALGFVSSAASARRPTPVVAAREELPADRVRFAWTEAEKAAAVQRHGVKAVAFRRDFLAQHRPTYACEIPLEGTRHRARDQAGSGRCWIFSFEHVLRSKLYAKGSRRALHLSPSFVNYYALRSRARRMLARVAVREGVTGADYVNENLGEGGWYPLGVELVRRYGLVPEQVMPTTRDGARSDEDYGVVLGQLKRVVAAAYQEIGAINESDREDRHAARLEVMKRAGGQIDALLKTTLGEPPQEFTYYGKRYTPKSFVTEYLGLKPADLDYVLLSNNPRMGFNRRYRYDVAEGGLELDLYNVSAEVIARATRRTLDGGEAVSFSINVSGANPHRVPEAGVPREAKGILSLAAFNYGAFVPEEKFAKRTRLRAGLGLANHAMVITGYDPAGAGGGVTKWKVDNSWGPEAGDRGHFHMYDDYFRQYGATVAVPRWALPEEVRTRLEGLAPSNDRPVARWTAGAKQKVVLELLREELTLNEAARRYKVPQPMLAGWLEAGVAAVKRALEPAPPVPAPPAP
ncbi:MAG: hypothetical protein IT371_28315 [Deltaproteobacteria bacterium]|nr:hypothetical protein [Deltaproteobacteria bacterium]